MQWPSITGGYLAVLALVYWVLAVNVVRLRRQNRAAFGDAGNPALRSAIRAHGHFAEYVPIIALMVAMLEMSGMAAWRVHLLMGALLISRLLHPFGMYAESSRTLAFRIGRVAGVTLTLIVLIASAVAILVRVLRGV
jgi:uncharacterized membrane protein YecN with MAPEG domain